MVDRLPKELVAVDLDGTLFAGSSLKCFFTFGLRKSLRKCDPVSVCHICFNVVLNRLGVLSHRRMKFYVVSLLEKKLSDSELDEFADELVAGLNPDVINFMEKKREEGAELLLTTASPESYSVRLASRVGIKLVCATSTTPELNNYIENRGEAKVESLKKILECGNFRLTTVLTDHHDDIPLMLYNYAGENLLVGHVSGKTTDLIRNAGIRVNSIISTGL